MPIVVTPELFIKTLAAMVDAERDRKAERMRSQTRAMALQFMDRTSSSTSGKALSPGGCQHSVLPSDGLHDSAWV